jgi:sialate O-acetylesterase
MVLQYNVNTNTITGTSSGSSVKVTLAGQTVTATVVSGNFNIKLPKISTPGGPYEITFEETPTGKKISLKNILFGDVFFCSGQSKKKNFF